MLGDNDRNLGCDRFDPLPKMRFDPPRYATLVGDEVVECSLERWIKQRGMVSDPRQRIVKQEIVGDRFWVSTVFLGLNHGLGDEALWFETMIFDVYSRDEQHGYPENIYCERYSTLVEARRGHQVAVEYARKLLADQPK